MTNKIERQISEPRQDDFGRTVTETIRMQVYYSKGRGIVAHIGVFEVGDTFEVSSPMDDCNRLFPLVNLTRAKPKVLAAVTEAMHRAEDRIFADLADWQDDDKWPVERRRAMTARLRETITSQVAI